MTNKIVLRDVDQFMADYQPGYSPIWGMFVSGKSQSYAQEVGKVNFKRLEAMGDLRLKAVTPKDTEMHQIAAAEKTKSYKKHFFAAQFVQSNLQDRQQNEDVVSQILDENQKLADDLLLLGEGTAANNVVNNALYWSGDPNYVLETSIEIDNADGWLTDLHRQIVTAKIKADLVSGRKVVIFYGSSMIPKINSLYAATGRAFKVALQEVLGGLYSTMELPAAVTPSGANGWMIVNMDQVKLHYSTLPSLQAQGINEEKMYTWHNFLVGSMMLEVLQLNAIIRQPVTFEA